MRILLIHRYFWPDSPPYGHILKMIAERLAADGYKVTVLTTQPSYKQNSEELKRPKRESISSVQIVRIWLPSTSRGAIASVFNSMVFALSVFIYILKHRCELVMISTMPPVAGCFAVRMACVLTGAKYLYHCMDLYPEILKYLGHLGGGMLYKLLLKIDRNNINGSVNTIVLSSDMKNTLAKREGINNEKILVLNNFEICDADNAALVEYTHLLKRPGKFRVLFAGNIGRFQGLETIIYTARKLSDNPDIEFVFMGEGKSLPILKEKAADLEGKNVLFIPHQPLNISRKVISNADMGVISLAKGVYHFSFPSKMMTYVCESLTLLVVVEGKSELASIVRSNGIGYVVEQNDAEAMKRAILKSFNNKSTDKEKMHAAFPFIERSYGMSQVLDAWSDKFKKLEEQLRSG